MKLLRCRDVGFDCDAEIRSESEEEILQQAAEHARRDHNLEVTPEVVQKVQAVIQDVNS